MKRIRIVGLMLLALFALGAVAATAASAEEGFLPLTKKGLQILSGEAKLETHTKLSINCTTTSGTGTFKNDSEGSGTFTFEKCTALGFPALSLTSTTSGQIKANVTYVVCLINSAELKFGIAITPSETVHIEVPAAGILLEVKGTIIGEILTKGPAKLYVVDFGGKEGLGNVAECKHGTTTIKKSFESKKCPEAFEEASQFAVKGLMQFEEEVELMDT
jgi:hypothetical protein